MRVSHFSSVDEKLADVNLLLWPLIFRPVVAAHQKCAGPDSNHGALVLISGPRETRQLYKHQPHDSRRLPSSPGNHSVLETVSYPNGIKPHCANRQSIPESSCAASG